MDFHKAQRQQPADQEPVPAAMQEGMKDQAIGPARAQASEVRAGTGAREGADKGMDTCAGAPCVQLHYRSPAELQADELRTAMGPQEIKQAAAQGLAGSDQQLPHLQRIQQAFGSHDVSGVRAHVGGKAEQAAGAMGATAYTSGNQVAFRRAPDLRTAAHEAAHVVQQRGGVQLKDGVGRTGDAYERHADAVAERVLLGKSAEALLNSMAAPAHAASAPASTQMNVQQLGPAIDKPIPEGGATPAHAGGTEATDQRRWSVEQFIEMWEKESGRKMSAEERKTLARGCIGGVVLRLGNCVNPPCDHAYATFDQAWAVVESWNAWIEANKGKTLANGQTVGDYEAILYSQLFWSNQDPDTEKRKKPDEKAFLPDPKTGKIDMSGYKYRAQPGYVNFDFAWWDPESNCFWHANHCDPGMQVYQSTKEKFAKGYIDFDRIIYCAGIAVRFKKEDAARASG